RLRQRYRLEISAHTSKCNSAKDLRQYNTRRKQRVTAITSSLPVICYKPCGSGACRIKLRNILRCFYYAVRQLCRSSVTPRRKQAPCVQIPRGEPNVYAVGEVG